MTEARVSDMEGIARRLVAGKDDLESWADKFHAVLVQGHTEARVLGRQRAGDLTGQTGDDERFGLDVADGQGDYLSKFLHQIKDGDDRYVDEDGNVLFDPLMVRCRQYASRFRGTANEAFVDAGELDDEYDWDLGPTEHCPDCVELHALGPYRPGAFISHPGDGQTDCKTNCACRLVRRRDGVSGFSRAEIYLS